MTKKITVSDAARVVLCQLVNMCRPRDAIEVRGQNVSMRELGLEEIEAIGSTEGGAARLDAMTADATTEREVTETSAIHLRKQLDRLGEIFPAGKTDAGVAVTEGMPSQWSRVLWPVIEQLDREFPEESTKAA